MHKSVIVPALDDVESFFDLIALTQAPLTRTGDQLPVRSFSVTPKCCGLCDQK